MSTVITGMVATMSNKEKSIHVVDFLGKKVDWESWSGKILLHGTWKRYKKMLVSSGSRVGVDEIFMQDKYGNALEGEMKP